MNLQENIPTQLRRRTHLLDRVIKNLLPNMYPCDYNSSDHFVEGVLDEIRWFLVDAEQLQGIERMDIENYILDYKYDELTEYFNEKCVVLKNDNLQETIKRILREESNKDILIDGLYDPIYEENGIVLFKEPKHLRAYSKFGIKKSNIISGKEFNKKYVDFNNKKLHKVLYKDGITLGGNLGEGKYWCSTEYCLSVYLGETHQSREYSKYVKEVVDFKLGDGLKILVKKYISDDLW